MILNFTQRDQSTHCSGGEIGPQIQKVMTELLKDK